ncbi:MAG: thiamine phosphate synthase [Planctomycetes bacterium]|nr:thiamine phosphate synthase [Planctomycetota bacterium]
MSARRLPGPLLALTPGEPASASAPEILRRAGRAIEAGLDSILLREPAFSDRETLDLARGLRALLGPRGWLGIHDRVHLAEAAGADGVHVGFRSLAAREARAIAAPTIAVGFSAHAHDAPEARAGADYLLFGPLFATPSKAGLLAPVGLETLARAVQASPVPLWAVGGITPDNAAALSACGAAGVAVRAAVLGARDGKPATRALLAVLPRGGPRPAIG